MGGTSLPAISFNAAFANPPSCYKRFSGRIARNDRRYCARLSESWRGQGGAHIPSRPSVRPLGRGQALSFAAPMRWTVDGELLTLRVGEHPWLLRARIDDWQCRLAV